MPRGPRPLRITEIREITREDLPEIYGPRLPKGQVKKIRESHHRMARLFAMGMGNVEVAYVTGYTHVRVSQLRNSPAMEELVASYRKDIQGMELKQIDHMMEQMTLIKAASDRHILDQIAELDEREELLPIKTALAISADMSDRIGYGKHQTNTNLNVDFGKQLDNAIKRSREIQEKTIEGPTAPIVPSILEFKRRI